MTSFLPMARLYHRPKPLNFDPWSTSRPSWKMQTVQKDELTKLVQRLVLAAVEDGA
jgi:hypothetical protein